MNDASFLSKLLLCLSIVLLSVTFLLLPMTLTRHTDDKIQMLTLRDTLDKDGMALPSPTRFSLSFTDNSLLRVVVFVVLLSVGFAGEFYIKSKKIGGVIHIVNILIALGMGSYFALSLVLPFTPL
ncbi:hypothetical protein ACFL4N_04520 [Thermodesulfobacteriota bacterium]